jgi:hypothetical protein
VGGKTVETEERPGPHLLTVELAAPSLVTRWRLHNAGNFRSSAENVRATELYGSVDGNRYFKIAAFANNSQAWVDLPVTCEQAVHYVQLRVIQAQQPAAMSERAWIAAFDVFGSPSPPASSTKP